MGLEEAFHYTKMAEATLGSERTAFEEAKKFLEGDVDQALTAKDAAKACV